jgi:FAD/FMN-containing dehydrogenase
VTTGQDPSVGLGGYIQGGGHGPLASTYGLAAQQVLQARVVTTKGDILVANEVENSDLFWAIRGGGAGQYGVVTEYVIRHYPAPESVIMGGISLAPLSEQGANVSWDAATILFNALPGLMDAGVAGAMSMASGSTGKAFNPSAPSLTAGAVVAQTLWGFNMSQSHFDSLLEPVIRQMHTAGSNETISISKTVSQFDNYTGFYSAISGSNTAGGGGVSSSRLLGHRHVDLPHSTLKGYLQRAVAAENATAGTYMTIGLSGGPGVIQTPEHRFGALLPAWKSAYLHLFVGGSSSSPSTDVSPSVALSNAAEWIEDNKESLWREWAPDSGSYMNEGNPYNTQFKHDFYGSNYDRLVEVKRKYDPSESLFVLSGVGSDGWDYDLQSGKLCRVL